MSNSGEIFNDAALAAPGKRVILLNGIPASGKSSLAVELSANTGWLALSVDGIKNPFLQRLEGVDRAFNRKLGQASYQVIWSIIGSAPAGSTFIVDAWFGFQPKELLADYLAQAGISKALEIWCQVSPETAAARYEARLGERLPGHLGAEYIPELKVLAEKAQPMALGPVYYCDRENPADINDIRRWIENNLR